MLKSWKPNLKQFVVTNMAVPVLVNQNVDLKSSFPICFEPVADFIAFIFSSWITW